MNEKKKRIYPLALEDEILLMSLRLYLDEGVEKWEDGKVGG